jgi:hypothetical protein
MANVALFVSFFLACSFMYGLTAFLFRDQIKRRDVRHRAASLINVVGLAIFAGRPSLPSLDGVSPRGHRASNNAGRRDKQNVCHRFDAEGRLPNARSANVPSSRINDLCACALPGPCRTPAFPLRPIAHEPVRADHP